jgi:hypothetical protein
LIQNLRSAALDASRLNKKKNSDDNDGTDSISTLPRSMLTAQVTSVALLPPRLLFVKNNILS